MKISPLSTKKANQQKAAGEKMLHIPEKCFGDQADQQPQG